MKKIMLEIDKKDIFFIYKWDRDSCSVQINVKSVTNL